jgi:hypothetical protein
MDLKKYKLALKSVDGGYRTKIKRRATMRESGADKRGLILQASRLPEFAL